MTAQLWEYTVTTELSILSEWLGRYGNFISVNNIFLNNNKKKKGRKKLRIACVQESAAEVTLGLKKESFDSGPNPSKDTSPGIS